jgi:quinate/shikimate dehydrogenase
LKDMITGHTKLTGLLGSPVEHSISPMMHNESFRVLGLDYAYLAFDVGEQELEIAVEGLKALKVKGFNLTMPNKNRMCRLCDQLSPAAEIIGAVNTVENRNGELVGHSTDGSGYMLAVKNAGYEILGKKMTLFGAGGAGTSILVQAALDGVAEISVFNRRTPFFERAEQIIRKLNERTSCKIRLYDYEDASVLRREIGDSAILTNATSVGMAPNLEACILKDTSMLPPDLIVSDVIYNPKETKLLKMAKEAGCRTFNGMYMLLYQGAEAFRIWTGQEMPVEHIKQMFFAS